LSVKLRVLFHAGSGSQQDIFNGRAVGAVGEALANQESVVAIVLRMQIVRGTIDPADFNLLTG
jgi:hypothetical protein